MAERSLVRIPQHLLHTRLDDLDQLGIPRVSRDRLRELIADLPLVPRGDDSAQLIGPPDVALPCLAVLARHVAQGLRDTNLSFAHDRPRLHAERGKLVFLDERELASVLDAGDRRPLQEAVVFIVDATQLVAELLIARHAAGLASFLTAADPMHGLPGRTIDLTR